jgi:hypothetical protein
MNDAIRLAIEKGGYRWKYYDGHSEFTVGKGNSEWIMLIWKHNNSSFSLEHNDVVVDPEFWKALGKALGWGDKCKDCYIGEPHEWCQHGSHLDMYGKYWKNAPWADAASRYFDIKLTGGDEDAFWKGLLQ